MRAIAIDPSLLTQYYFAKLPLPTNAFAARKPAGPLPPWDISVRPPSQEAADAAARSSKPYFDPKDRSLFGSARAGANAGSQLEALIEKTLSKPGSEDAAVAADNHKLFALYQALNRLDHIAKMANREGTVDGMRPGLNAQFQDGLTQVLAYMADASFNGITLMPGRKSASTESSVTIPYSPFNYTGKGVISHSGWSSPVPGVTASDSFTVSITKAGVTTDVAIDFADISGPLTIDNINAHVNQQLANAGFATKFARVQTGGSIAEDTATWGVRINNAASETVTLSSSQAEAAVYIAGMAGAPAGQQGKLTKITDLDTAPKSQFSVAITPENGTAQAKATVVDGDGNVYVVGNTTGDLGGQLNQGSQDVFLTKYDSAGQVTWTRLLGSADTASGYALSLDPTGGVVIAGSVNGDLKPTSIGSGSDSFVAKYDAQGNQTWLRQIAPVANDHAMSVTVDATGAVYVGGQLSGAISGSHTSAGGTDAFITKLSTTGSLVYHRQFGTAGTDSAVQLATASDGNLIVASTQNGRAIVSKYDASVGTGAALWQMDLGELQGSIGGLAVDGDQVYVSGTTSNTALNAGGAASIAQASSGGSDAFVFNLTDAGASATADYVSYVGTGAGEQGGGIAVANGKLYLTGTTTGTFAGQTRTVENTHNSFVAQLTTAGVTDWTQQYGGAGAQSKGIAIAVDTEGASVLDRLGLRRGKIQLNQSTAIAAQTTARAGDYFTMKITDESGTRSVKVQLGDNETLRSLATKINAYLMFDGKATAMPSSGGQKLKIAVNPGVQVELIAGEKDFDALAGLGIRPQVLVNEAKSDDKNAKAETRVFGLALTEKLDLLSKSTASRAHVAMMAAMSVVKQAYNTLNPPPAQPQQFAGASAGFANYEIALANLSAIRPGGTSI